MKLFGTVFHLDALGLGSCAGSTLHGTGGTRSGEGNGESGLIPVHILAHQLTDGPHGQIMGTIVKNSVNLLTLGVVEIPFHTVHHHRYLRPHFPGDGGHLVRGRCGKGERAQHHGSGQRQRAQSFSALLHRLFHLLYLSFQFSMVI